MSGVQTPCPLNVRTNQISALYDGDLGAEAASLREHITACAACQRRLDAYTRISIALKEQTVPEPDARLRQIILAAREHAIPSAHLAGRTQDTWRAAAIAAAVILIIGAFAGALLQHAGSRRIASAPTATPNQATQTTTIAFGPTAPPGWRTLLPTRRFSVGGSQGFAVSAAQPGRLVGCGVPGSGTDVWPYPALAISDDGGQNWQESFIQALGSVTECVVVVDQLHPDTIIVGEAEPSQLAVTTDAGRTWRTLKLPAGMLMNFAQGAGYQAPALVDGQLIGIFHSVSASARWALGDLSISGDFKVLDATLPYPNASTMHTPLAFAVDPADASHLYVIAADGSDPAHLTSAAHLYTSIDAGATWWQVHTLASGERFDLWSPTPNTLYLWISYPEMSSNGNPLQQSVDGGVTWRAITPAGFRIDSVWFGPSGHIVLLGDAANSASTTLDELNSTTSALTPMGSLPDMSTSGFQGILTGGAHPVFVVADPHATFARPLP